MSDTTTHTACGRPFTAVRKASAKARIAMLTGLIALGSTAALLAAPAAANASTAAATVQQRGRVFFPAAVSWQFGSRIPHPIYMQLD